LESSRGGKSVFIIDDIINAIGASQAAQAQQRNVQQALDLQREMYRQQRSDQAPFLQAGYTSLGDLMKLKDNPDSIQNSAAYQFRLSEGQKALERSAAARGGLASGGFMKGMARFGQGLASDEYGNQWNRLMGLANMGQGSANQLGGDSSHYADSGSSLYGAMGNAEAAGITGAYGGAAGAVRSAGNLATLGLGGGFASLGIPGLAGAGGGAAAGGGAMSALIPRQRNYG
jgi:hypothetical protein